MVSLHKDFMVARQKSQHSGKPSLREGGFRLALWMLFLDFHPLKLLADWSPAKSSGLNQTPRFGGVEFILADYVHACFSNYFHGSGFSAPRKITLLFYQDGTSTYHTGDQSFQYTDIQT